MRRFTPSLIALCLLGCLDSSDSGDTSLLPTMIGVEPETFLEGIPCRHGSTDSPGAPQWYRATLINVDVGGGDPVSSEMTNCNLGVAFDVADSVGSAYSMKIEVFDQAAPDPTQPAWTSCCASDNGCTPPAAGGTGGTGTGGTGTGGTGTGGTGTGGTGTGGTGGTGGSPAYAGIPTRSFAHSIQYTEPCAPLTWVTGDPTADGTATVSATTALGNTGDGTLVCHEDPTIPPEKQTVVLGFKAVKAGGTLPPPESFATACEATLEVGTAAPGTGVSSKMFGYEKGSPLVPSWYSSCGRTVVADMTLPSSCDTFQTNGIAIDLTLAAQTIPAICIADDQFATVAFSKKGDVQNVLARVDSVYCKSLLFFGNKAPGEYVACVLDSSGATVAQCEASFDENRVAEAVCGAPTTCLPPPP